jgi:hypothetical protein
LRSLSGSLSTAFVVADPGPTEARLEEVMRGERRKARRQRPLAADENPRHRWTQIVVRDPQRHAARMREGARVPVEKADLILPLVDPTEIPAGVHQAQHKEPRLPSLARDINEHFEEIDLRQIRCDML